MERTNWSRLACTTNDSQVEGALMKSVDFYSVGVLDKSYSACCIAEKPHEPQCNCSVTSLYFYDKHEVETT